jgi:hypothetical protein
MPLASDSGCRSFGEASRPLEQPAVKPASMAPAADPPQRPTERMARISSHLATTSKSVRPASATA